LNERITAQIGRNIREIRIQKGFSQKFLADTSHCGFDYIQNVESGHMDVTLVRAYKIAGALGCPVSDLYRELQG
jgi:transcriptional regulator with XRE-family HTH domain